MNGSSKGIHINVTGVVQGVGYRWFAKQAAERWSVGGFVKNLYDGSVAIYAEGDEISLKGFLQEVQLGPRYAHVAGVNYDWVEWSGKYREFRIEL
jgi:acylphosphatase